MIVPSYHVGGHPDHRIIYYKTTDFGMNWTIMHQFICVGLNNPPLNVYGWYKQVGFIYAICMYDPGYFRTNTGGDIWNSNISMSGLILPNAISYVDTGIIYGIFSSGIARCLPGGQTFTLMKSGVFSKICVVDSNNILASSNSKIFRSTNAGANWDSIIFPVRLNSITFPDQNTGYLTGSNGKIYKSTDRGATWISQITPTTDSLVDCCFLNSNTGYVIGFNGTLLKTNTGGISTSSVSGFVRYSDNNQPVTSGKVKAFKFDKNTWNVIYVDSANIQSDGSYTLPNVPQDSVDIGVFPNSTPPNDWVITYYPSTIYWELATTLYPTGNLTNININAIRLAASTNNNSVNGRITGIADNPSSNLKDAVIYAKNGNTFVRCAVSDSGGIYHLQSLPAGSIKIIATRLGFSRDSATVNVTASGNTDSINFLLHRFTVGINQISSEVPSEFKLFQNYPNPFNPNTIIRFQIKESRMVSLKVYDILGKEIVTLVNEKLKAGDYEIPFSNNQIPSGAYFYKLTSGDFTETKRMVLLK